MGLLRPASWEKGFHSVFEPPQGELRLLSFGLLSLDPGEIWQQTFVEQEAALIVLGGKCEIWTQAQHWPEVGAREGVFGGQAYALYLPAQSDLRLKAHTDFEAALFTAPADQPGEAVLVTPEQVNIRTVGAGSWRRSVQDIIDLRVPAQRLVIGETYNQPGGWSSYPPHKHDQEIPGTEVRMEEIYHFRVNPPQGFGFQRLYSPEVSLDEAYVIKDGDTVAIPRGYHAVAAAPGYTVYYLWGLAGDRRELLPHDEPAHAWLHGTQ